MELIRLLDESLVSERAKQEALNETEAYKWFVIGHTIGAQGSDRIKTEDISYDEIRCVMGHAIMDFLELYEEIMDKFMKDES